MPVRIPPNFPLSQTGVAIIDWICDAERYGVVYPDDYIVNGAPATMEIDLSQEYSIARVTIPVSKGYIPQIGTGVLVQAVEITPSVAARLASGGGISEQAIVAVVEGWTDQTPTPIKVRDIKNLIKEGEVSY
jgi:exosome complex RNA-binding protein Rrp42 (RNase PH superfamily)